MWKGNFKFLFLFDYIKYKEEEELLNYIKMEIFVL